MPAKAPHRAAQIRSQAGPPGSLDAAAGLVSTPRWCRASARATIGVRLFCF